MTRNSILIGSFVIGLATLGAQVTSAQDSDTTDDAAGGQIGVDMGTEVSADEQLGKLYERETHGDWSVRCVHTETPENDPCQMNQVLKDEGGNNVAEISVFPLPESQRPGVAGATIAVPLETLLTADLRIAIDGSNEKRYRYSWCTTEGCFAQVGFTAEDVAAFKRGAGAVLTLVPVIAPDQEVKIPLSLTGFTAAYDALPTP